MNCDDVQRTLTNNINENSMSDSNQTTGGDTNSQTTAIVSAYLSNNSMDAAGIPGLIRSVQEALSGGTVAAPEAEPAEAPLTPAVSIRKSVTPKSVTCLECGKGFKSLKRHIGTAHDLTAKEYKERWDLPRDYPLVAPEYSARRAETARKIGLGRKKKA